MTGGKKSPENPGRLSVKRGTKLMSKSSKPSSSTNTDPPKTAVTASNAKHEEGHRRRNPFNDMLRRRDPDDAVSSRDPQHVADRNAGPGVVASVAREDAESDRVANLERNLAAAKEEQDLMRQELVAVRASRQPDQDLINELRSQLDEKQQCIQSTAAQISSKKRRSSSASIDHTNEENLKENYELRYKIGLLQDQVNLQHSPRPDHSNSHTEEEWDSLRSRLHAAEKESQERLHQLVSLKKSISSLTRTESQVTDSDLTEAFTQLFDRIRDWTVSNFRRSTLNFNNTPSETMDVVSAMLPNAVNVASVDKLALCQAIVSHFCMRFFEERLLVGLPDTSPSDLADAAPLDAIRRCDQALQNGGVVHREWQRATIRAIEQSSVGDLIRQSRDNLTHQIAREIGHVLFTITSVSLSQRANSALTNILRTAADVQRMIALQRARYQVTFFRPIERVGFKFDRCKMEVVNDLDNDMEDGSIFAERDILFCVSPCLEKYGDEQGENLETNNVLFKAKICYS
ncbi:hypothetical protein NX059_008342 [Plenodomus lindquistii]|nr:hypothetical protein NX059_008342 [Plenodomus lindquistii]